MIKAWVNITLRTSRVLCWIVVINLHSCTLGLKPKHTIVFAAASLSGVLDELAVNFNKTSKVVVKISASSSGILARHIKHGAKTELFISASEDWVDYVSKECPTQFTRKDSVARNTLVVVSQRNIAEINSTILDSLLVNSVSRIAIGDPMHVPAGVYAKMALRKMGIWGKVEANILPTKDVHSALRLVELGECEYGVVYASDVVKAKAIHIVYSFDMEKHQPINYYAIVNTQSELFEEAQLFLDYIKSSKVDSIWLKHGFKRNKH